MYKNPKRTNNHISNKRDSRIKRIFNNKIIPFKPRLPTRVRSFALSHSSGCLNFYHAAVHQQIVCESQQAGKSK